MFEKLNLQKAWKKAGEITTRVLDYLCDTELVLPAPHGYCPRVTQNAIKISGSWSKGVWYVAFGERIELQSSLGGGGIYNCYMPLRPYYKLMNPEGFGGKHTNLEVLEYLRIIDKALGNMHTPYTRADIKSFENAARVFGVSLEKPQRAQQTSARPIPSGEALTQ